MQIDDLHHHFEIKLHSTIHPSFGLIDFFRRLVWTWTSEGK